MTETAQKQILPDCTAPGFWQFCCAMLLISSSMLIFIVVLFTLYQLIFLGHETALTSLLLKTASLGISTPNGLVQLPQGIALFYAYGISGFYLMIASGVARSLLSNGISLLRPDTQQLIKLLKQALKN